VATTMNLDRATKDVRLSLATIMMTVQLTKLVPDNKRLTGCMYWDEMNVANI